MVHHTSATRPKRAQAGARNCFSGCPVSGAALPGSTAVSGAPRGGGRDFRDD